MNRELSEIDHKEIKVSPFVKTRFLTSSLT